MGWFEKSLLAAQGAVPSLCIPSPYSLLASLAADAASLGRIDIAMIDKDTILFVYKAFYRRNFQTGFKLIWPSATALAAIEAGKRKRVGAGQEQALRNQQALQTTQPYEV